MPVLILVTLLGAIGQPIGERVPSATASAPCAQEDPRTVRQPRPVRVGAYWWDGWFAGSPYVREPLTSRFPEREPIWGWRDDNQDAVDTAIKFAARFGVDFFAFLWYPDDAWRFPGGQPSGVMNNGLHFYLSSEIPERERVGFLIMVVHAPKGEEWQATCRMWAQRYLAHPGYVRIAGRPAIFFYQLEELDRKLGGRERIRPALDVLRDAARGAGCAMPFLVLRAVGQERRQLSELGFDGATDYALAHTPIPGEHPYADLVQTARQVWQQYAGRKSNYIPSVTSGWDGRPREWMKKPYYRYWYRRSADEFGALVKEALAWVRSHPQDVPQTPLLMVYAWNELDEGGAICPTKKEGTAYLEALRTARD